MNHRVVVAAFIEKDNKILFGRKPKGVGPFPDTWHIPGGGVNLGEETCEEAIHREVLEETGLKVKNLEKLEWDTGVENNKLEVPTYYIFLVYYCEYESGELIPGDDMEHFEWIEKDKVKDLEHARKSLPLFKKLGLIK